MFLTFFVFNPRDLYYRGYKKIIIIIKLCVVLLYFMLKKIMNSLLSVKC